MHENAKMLEIIYQDDFLVAINKPNGLLVHRSSIATNTDEYALQLLRDQIGMKVFPCHRLDRKTSGVLLFALNPEIQKLVNDQFMNNETSKTYWAIVRGFTPEVGSIDYALTNDKGKIQEALTHFTCLNQSEVPIASGKFETSRYSLVEVKPVTGRMHQIRKHFAHIFHPIIGDRPHGCNKQNKLFLETWNMNTMLLHSKDLSLQHPVTHQRLTLSAILPAEFLRVQEILRLNHSN